MRGGIAAADRQEHRETLTTDSILAWISAGGTQQPDKSFAGWKDLDTGVLSPAYPEITGYVLGLLATAGDADVEPDSGRAAAGWLSSRVLRGDLRARPEKTGSAVYAFDVAMAGHGLLRYGAVFSSERAESAGLACAEYLMRLIDEHGSICAIDPRTLSGAVTPAWSTTGSAHLLKCVQALLSAHTAGEPTALDYAERLVRTEVDRWERSFPPRTCPESDVLGLHALCYAAEGLWIWASFSGDDKALSLSRDLTEWLWARRLGGGGFPAFTTETGRGISVQRQCDVAAQVLRLSLLHRDLGIDISDELHQLSQDSWIDGAHAGMLYQPGSGARHANCWASMFAYQALQLSGSAGTLSWFELV